ncbi:FAD-binding oxidoreductase [Candidatus Pantoea deserta]|uniref:FAD-binding oxidoreductase n=1 Tax=Candidatus Pantoea deserta TaxID=1869313 RepID=A0A3N4ND77_9GAMM|nr:FAD-binding oxidoreductase [Pantoea deserta]RPD94264.1 FAD-binding oxidoreductase [Pantoea deserta]
MKKITVVGAGIIGLSVAYYLHKEGAEVTVVDRQPEGDKTSFGNAGGIAVTEVIPAAVPGIFMKVPGWMLDPLGPLAVRPAHALKLLPWLLRFYRSGKKDEFMRIYRSLSVLNSRVYNDLLPMLEDTGLMKELHRDGALTVYETEAGYNAEKHEWELREQAGIRVQHMTGDEARALEPALSSKVTHAVFTPQWSHINDPKVIVDELRGWLIKQGVNVIKGDVGEIQTAGAGQQQVKMKDGRTHFADDIVIAAGVWSRKLAEMLGEKSLVESERGYNTTIQDSGVQLSREVIFAERKFVATPLSCGLRIGGAAEFGGINDKPNYKRASSLAKLAEIYLPTLKKTEGIHWAGHRPSTPDSLPVISRSSLHSHVYYAFGHGHLGLTQSATTGRLIADLIYSRPDSLDYTPYSIKRFN